MSWLDPLRRRRASVYGAGPHLDQAIAICRRLEAAGVASVVGYAASAGEPPRRVAEVHLAALERLAASDLDTYVSVKLSALGFDESLFRELVDSARDRARRIHLDALSPTTVDRTLSLLDSIPADSPIGTTLAGRWTRSVADADRLVGRGLRIRVVKGQWAGGAGADRDPEHGFLEVVDHLRGSPAEVAVATHDVRLLTESLRRLTGSGTRAESELFLGMPFSGQARAARGLGVPVRIYVPFGDTGVPYHLRDLRSRPEAAWWLAQDLALGRLKTWRGIHATNARR